VCVRGEHPFGRLGTLQEYRVRLIAQRQSGDGVSSNRVYEMTHADPNTGNRVFNLGLVNFQRGVEKETGSKGPLREGREYRATRDRVVVSITDVSELASG